MSDDFRRVREIFETALEQTPAARLAFVEQACGRDAALLREVVRMLDGDIGPCPLLDRGLQLTAYTLRAESVFADDFAIIEAIGRGGMGEVYRAHDQRLDRVIALKLLPQPFASDAERVARFTREAHVLGALNHPNIAAIYGFVESDDQRALVLELVDGPTLEQRLDHGPIPMGDVCEIARQIAEALEAAHEQGFVHRDLKPANIKLRPDGTVKLLDFGLAKIATPEGSGNSDIPTSPTITGASMIERGVLLGSAAYVSPEQARGREADKRSDIWAFGAVLYEMLSGRRAFQGLDAPDTVASVLRDAIDWSALPPSTPDTVRHLLARCLERDVRQRLRDIGEARIVLADANSLLADPRRPQPTRWTHGLSTAAIALVTAVLGALAVWWLRPSPLSAVTRLTLSLPAGATLSANRSVVAISPDGTQVAFVTPAGLHLRVLSTFDTHVISGSEGIFNITEPAFSPDGRSIVFHTSVDQTLRKIPVGGGAPVTLARVTAPHGLNWGRHGIVFVESIGNTTADHTSGDSSIKLVSADGGAPQTLVALRQGEVAHHPEILPDGTHLLFTLASDTSTERWDRASIVVQSLASGERKVLLAGGSDARYVPTGHLVYAIGGSLFAVAFDATRRTVSSPPVPVLDGIRREDATSSGGAHFSVSASGTLVYVAGPRTPGRDLALTDHAGNLQRLNLPRRAYEAPRISPDGTRLVVGSDDGREAVIWMYSLAARDTVRRLTFDGGNRFPIWARDNAYIAFQSDREGDRGIFRQLADGSGAAERLTRSKDGEWHEPEAWSPTADVMLFSIRTAADATLWMFTLKDKRPSPSMMCIRQREPARRSRLTGAGWPMRDRRGG